MSRDLALAQRLATPDRERCKVRTGRAAAAATRSRIGLVSRRPAGSERHEFDVLGAPGDGGDLVLLELPVERLAADPEHPRGERLAPADRLHHTQDVAALDLLERRELGRIVARDQHVRALEAADLLREIVEADRLVPREGDRPRRSPGEDPRLPALARAGRGRRSVRARAARGGRAPLRPACDGGGRREQDARRAGARDRPQDALPQARAVQDRPRLPEHLARRTRVVPTRQVGATRGRYETAWRQLRRGRYAPCTALDPAWRDAARERGRETCTRLTPASLWGRAKRRRSGRRCSGRRAPTGARGARPSRWSS